MTAEAEFSYAVNAARRAEKRRMCSFVRLLDYMICNALQAVLVSRLKAYPNWSLQPVLLHHGLVQCLLAEALNAQLVSS